MPKLQRQTKEQPDVLIHLYAFWSDSLASRITSLLSAVVAYFLSYNCVCPSISHVTSGAGWLSIAGRSSTATCPDSTLTCRSVVPSNVPISVTNTVPDQTRYWYTCTTGIHNGTQLFLKTRQTFSRSNVICNETWDPHNNVVSYCGLMVYNAT